jgi:hypothetical protein
MIKNEDANGYDRDWTIDTLLSVRDDCAAVQIISEIFRGVLEEIEVDVVL